MFPTQPQRFSFWCLALLLLGGGLSLVLPSEAQVSSKAKPIPTIKVEFDRDIRPILADNCYKCHGFDEKQRQAKLRLDTTEGAFAKLASGKPAIVPKKPEMSNLLLRIKETGALKMPPVSTGKKITTAQYNLLKAWIAQGAQYADHWAFIPPKRPPLPTVKNTAWVRNPIDRFLLARMEKAGLKPNPDADKATLLRRLSLDLTGLVPTPQDLDAFLQDKSPNAYVKQVERLLASPHFGERMAIPWLDLARYADTHGYHIDSHRDMWRWREWVIQAFNENKPFDKFTIEQLAGDLLPNPTLDQRVATGFNRNHPINFEGGAIPEEYHAAYIFDRIDTTATTWMGMTMRCAQCHDHKYDPISMKDYYKFYGLFNNVPENGLDGTKGNAVPFLKVPYPEQKAQLETFAKLIAAKDQEQKNRAAEIAPAFAAWQERMRSLGANAEISIPGITAHYAFEESTGAVFKSQTPTVPEAKIVGKADWQPGKVGKALRFDGQTYADLGDTLQVDRAEKFSYGAWVYPTDPEGPIILSRMNSAQNSQGWDLSIYGRKAMVHLINSWPQNAIRVNSKVDVAPNQWTHIFATYDGSSKARGVKIYINGKPVELDYTNDNLTDTIRTNVTAKIGTRTDGGLFRGMLDDVRFFNRELTASEVNRLANFETIRPILAISPDKRTPDQQQVLVRHYQENEDQPYVSITAELGALRIKHSELDNAIPTTMVMQEMDKPRDTFILMRGEYDKKGEKVLAGIPDFISASRQPALALHTEKPSTRLQFAEWLVRPDHPLTARVAVNRFWQQFFGVGIVKTSEDFGSQGERPFHPELFDWLATEFTRTNWDMKGLVRLMVTSRAYQQTSKVTKEHLERDPENRYVARGARFRLAGEFLRDIALQTSGLLVPKIGGPSVRPYHPAGLWEDIAFGGEFSAQTYVQEKGEALYRRGMYTFWKRTVPPPSLQSLDAPEREFCVVRRSVTNTPLQALVLMNDPTFVEAARKFAERILVEGGATAEARTTFAYRVALQRKPTVNEQQIVLRYLQQQITAFKAKPESAKKLLQTGESPVNPKLETSELAAWTTVASLLYNLDEFVTKN